MDAVVVEVRAAEGGADAKLLVEDTVEIYAKTVSLLEGL